MEQKIITIENCTANATQAVAQVAAEQNITAKPATIADRIAGFANNVYLNHVRRKIVKEREILESLADETCKIKRNLQIKYAEDLKVADAWRDGMASQCKMNLAKLSAELKRNT